MLDEEAHVTTRNDLVTWGCAPGGYLSRCHNCDRVHQSAKRAWSCQPCAEAMDAAYWDAQRRDNPRD